MTNYWNSKNEDVIVWNDKNLKIKFRVKKLIISKTDKELNTFDEFLRKFKSL